MALTPSKKTPPKDRNTERQAAQDEVLLREIDDAVRQDDYARFAKTWGRPLLGLLIAGLLAFGGYLYWQSEREAAMEAESEQLVSALDQLEAGNLDAANEVAATIAAGDEAGAAAIAKLLQAGIAAEQGRKEEAEKLYSQLAADENVPEALRNLALIREMASSFDTRDPADVIARLKPLAVPGNPWFGSAGELVAMAYLEQDKRGEAGTLLAEIAKSEEVPQSLRSRARQLAGLLGVDAIDDVEELLEEQGVDAAPAAAADMPAT